jgi:hypothetical protein
MGNKVLYFCKGLAAAGLKSRWPLTSISTLVTFCFYHCLRAHAEDQVGYRFEQYQEDNGRMGIETDSFLFDLQPKSWLTLAGEGVYDAISGFTPTGSPPPNTITFVETPPPPGASSSSVPLSHMEDERYAGSLSATLSYKNNRFTPQLSYSREHDYLSRGGSLNYSVYYNDKNTTLNLGISHDWDKVLPHGFLFQEAAKNSEEILVGVNQLLNPKAVLTANFTYGHASGYLNDQYRGVLFDNEPQGDPTTPALEPENRPQTKDRFIGYVSLTQAVTPFNASAELSYRFSHDTAGVNAHTLQVAWYQKLGKHVVLSPMFRYYYQNAADYYVVRLPDYNTRPTYYSADYRLSNLETFAAGVSLNWKIEDWLSVDVAYQRYVMKGLDGITSPTAYPSANVFTIGARIWF